MILIIADQIPFRWHRLLYAWHPLLVCCFMGHLFNRSSREL